MTNYDKFIKETATVQWIADAIENKLDCDTCPALALCEMLYPVCLGNEMGEEAATHCNETICQWLNNNYEGL